MRKLLSLITVFILLTSISMPVYAATETEEITIELETNDDESIMAALNSTIVIDAVEYTLIDYQIIESTPIEHTRTNTIQTTKTTDAMFDSNYVAPSELTENGITYKLQHTSSSESVKSNRSTNTAVKMQYKDYEYAADIADTISSTYNDTITGSSIPIILTKSSVEKSNEHIVNVSFPIEITLGDALYYRFGEHILKYDADDPGLTPYLSEIFNSLGWDPNVYTLDAIAWNGDEYIDANGLRARQAIATGTRKIADYNVVYNATVNLPDAVSYVYTSIYEAQITETINSSANNYVIKLIATYESDDSTDLDTTKEDNSIVPIVIGVVAILIILLLIVILLYVSSKKKKKERRTK